MKFLEPTRKPKVSFTLTMVFGKFFEEIILDSLYVNTTQIRDKWESERRDICGAIAVRSGSRTVGGFYGMFLLSSKHSRSLVWWGDTQWKMFRNAFWPTNNTVCNNGRISPYLCEKPILHGLGATQWNKQPFVLMMHVEISLRCSEKTKTQQRTMEKDHLNFGKRKTKHACVVDADENTHQGQKELSSLKTLWSAATKSPNVLLCARLCQHVIHIITIGVHRKRRIFSANYPTPVPLLLVTPVELHEMTQKYLDLEISWLLCSGLPQEALLKYFHLCIPVAIPAHLATVHFALLLITHFHFCFRFLKTRATGLPEANSSLVLPLLSGAGLSAYLLTSTQSCDEDVEEASVGVVEEVVDEPWTSNGS